MAQGLAGFGHRPGGEGRVAGRCGQRVAAALRRVTTEFAVTDHRIIYKRGIIGRYTIEMARAKVESVDVQQGPAGRAFNYGTIIVRGTGGGLEPIQNVESPLRLRSAILAQ